MEVIEMAKHKTRRAVSVNLDNKMLLLVVLGLLAGFVGGFLFAKNRYMGKITEISKLNMEKAVTIDTLTTKLQVLGVSTEAGK